MYVLPPRRVFYTAKRGAFSSRGWRLFVPVYYIHIHNLCSPSPRTPPVEGGTGRCMGRRSRSSGCTSDTSRATAAVPAAPRFINTKRRESRKATRMHGTNDVRTETGQPIRLHHKCSQVWSERLLPTARPEKNRVLPPSFPDSFPTTESAARNLNAQSDHQVETVCAGMKRRMSRGTACNKPSVLYITGGCKEVVRVHSGAEAACLANTLGGALPKSLKKKQETVQLSLRSHAGGYLQRSSPVCAGGRQL